MTKWKLMPVEPTPEMQRLTSKRFWAQLLDAAPEPEPCVWTQDRYGGYETSCNDYAGKCWPTMKFCCYCGHPLKVVEHE